MLKIAAPWALQAYQTLHHNAVSYRAFLPKFSGSVTVHMWDLQALFHGLSADGSHIEALDRLSRTGPMHNDIVRSSIAKSLSLKDQLLVADLPGDVELFHSTAFPSLHRPFVLLSDSIDDALMPFMARGVRRSVALAQLQILLEHPRCLIIGALSPSALDAFYEQLGSELINSKLRLLQSEGRASLHNMKRKRQVAVFLPNRARGSSVEDICSLLKVWSVVSTSLRDATLILCAPRPSQVELDTHGIILDKTVHWGPEEPTHSDFATLLEAAQLVLHPSHSPDWLDLRAAALSGAKPVLVGTKRKEISQRANAEGYMFVIGPDPMTKANIPAHDARKLIEFLVPKTMPSEQAPNVSNGRWTPVSPIQLWNEVQSKLEAKETQPRTDEAPSLPQALMTSDSRCFLTGSGRPRALIDSQKRAFYELFGNIYVTQPTQLDPDSVSGIIYAMPGIEGKSVLDVTDALIDVTGAFFNKNHIKSKAIPTFKMRSARLLARVPAVFSACRSAYRECKRALRTILDQLIVLDICLRGDEQKASRYITQVSEPGASWAIYKFVYLFVAIDPKEAPFFVTKVGFESYRDMRVATNMVDLMHRLRTSDEPTGSESFLISPVYLLNHVFRFKQRIRRFLRLWISSQRNPAQWHSENASVIFNADYKGYTITKQYHRYRASYNDSQESEQHNHPLHDAYTIKALYAKIDRHTENQSQGSFR